MSLYILTYLIMGLTHELQSSELNECKLTHKGTEYAGKLSQSESGSKCLSWKDVEHFHHDMKFPEGSRTSARNYCRNPTGDLQGPWCYIKSSNGVVSQSCRIPLCRINECRWTGPGVEYFGNISKSAAGRSCLPWVDSTYYSSIKTFEMCSDNPACNSCRNPDFTNDGPWCVVLSDEGGQVIELCDIPFCHEGRTLLIDSGDGHISNYHQLTKQGELTLRFRLWRSEGWLEQRVAILLSTLDIWMTTNEIADWGAGIVLSMGNTKSVIVGNQLYDQAESAALLTATKWTIVTLNWKKASDSSTLVLTASFNNQHRPSLVAEIDTTAMLLQEADFQYISVFGSPSLWSFDTIETCLVTTTSQGNKTEWLKLVKDLSEMVFNASVRLSHIGTIELASSNREPLLQVYLLASGKINMRIIRGGKITFSSEVKDDPFYYWKWETLQVSILGDSMVLKRWNGQDFRVVTEAQSLFLREVSWLTTWSTAVAHWSINCQPEAVEKAEPPNCAHSQADNFYNGSQNIAATGLHCLPWIDSRLPHFHTSEKKFQAFGGKLHSQNYCRNLNHEQSGPYCYVRTAASIHQQICAMRICETEECKLSGTGVEYVGNKSITESLRKCQSIGNASAVCRNINKSVGGPWCFTEDPLAPRDRCSIKDCSREDDQLILASTNNNSSAWYILPAWRRNGMTFWLKNWQPEQDTSDVILNLADDQLTIKLKIKIGGGSNDKVQLISVQPERILAEATVAHLLRLASWTELNVRFGKESIELSMDKSETPFLYWAGEVDFSISTLCISTTLVDAWIGMHVNPSDCISEHVWGEPRRLWAIPPNWQLSHQNDQVSVMDIFLLGSGIANINFYAFPEDLPVLSLVIRVTDSLDITLVKKLSTGENTLNHTRIGATNISREWINLEVKYSEDSFILEMDNKTVLEKFFKDEVILIYWIGLSVKSGSFAWAVNCKPLEINKTVRNGGWGPWSEWQCSVSCGGGEGRRERSCNSPTPSMMGNYCVGPQVHTGICNDYPCGDVPPYLLKAIRSDLATKATRETVRTGQALKIHCNINFVQNLKNVTRDASFSWSINGFHPNNPRITEDESANLVINNASAQDTGVWLCSATWSVKGKLKSVAMRVVALSVTADLPTVSVRSGQLLQMFCNSYILTHLYRDLSAKWTLNDNRWTDQGITDMEEMNSDRIVFNEVGEEVAGVWKCSVYQHQLHLEWTTAWIRLEVLPKPSFWTYLEEDDATAPIFGGLTEEMAKFIFWTLVFIILSIPLSFLATVFYLKV